MPSRLTLFWTRIALVLVGAVLVTGQSLQAWQSGASAHDWLAPALSVVVFAGAVYCLLPGGLICAAWASATYGVLLARAHMFGPPSFAAQLLTHAGTYFFYAVFVGLGTGHLQDRLQKLELADQLDRVSELYNASFFVQNVAVEASRSDRYHRPFSIAEVAVPRSGFGALPRRRYRAVIRALGQRIRSSVRAADNPVRVDDGERDRFIVILPETGWDGAEVFTRRLELAVRNFLAEHGYKATREPLSARSLSYPVDAVVIGQLRDEMSRMDVQPRRGRHRAPVTPELEKITSDT